MKIRASEDYYFWCCDWCDTENRVFWTKLEGGANCGACHRPMSLPDSEGTAALTSPISAGLY